MPIFRYAVRSLRRSPLFAAIAILSLGLALALNTTMFAIVDALIHPTLPYHDGGRAFTVMAPGGSRTGPTFEDKFRAIKEGLHSAEMVVPYYFNAARVQSGNTIEDQYVANVPHEMFGILGVRPAAGRAFNANDERSDARPVAIISYALWIRFFQEKSLDRRLTIEVGRGRYEVIGVMPRGMHWPVQDVWLPRFSVVSDNAAIRLGPWALMQLRSGASRASAKAELDVAMAALTTAMSPARPVGGLLTPFDAVPRGLNRGQGNKYIFMVVGTVLLIACANLGTMLLARGMVRRREIAIRMALGASRAAIAKQVLTECALIVGLGVALGALLTTWAIYVLPHYAIPYVPGIGDLEPTPSWRVFAFAVSIAMATFLVAGGIPALRAATVNPAEPMKDGAGATGRRRDRYNALIVVEVALSTALLMTGALFTIFLLRLVAVDFSYAAKQLQVARLQVREKDMPADSAVERFYDDLVGRMATLPGVRGAATSREAIPDGRILFAEEGRSGAHWINSRGYTVVSPSYFSTLGIPIADGRDFQAGDQGIATGVVIVDDNAARRLWPGMRTPVGRMIKLGTRESNQPWLRVVGVVPTVDLTPRGQSALPSEPRVFVVFGHDHGRDRSLIIRGDGRGGAQGQAALAIAIRREIERIAPWIRTRSVHRWLEGYENTRNMSAFFASLFSAFAAFGLVLCAVGLYGVLAYTVSRRLRELATRVALGAQARDVVWAVLHDAIVTVLAGIAIGAFIALAATRSLVDGMFNDVRFELVIALVAAEAILLSVAALACVGPIRAALRANPVEILRAN